MLYWWFEGLNPIFVVFVLCLYRFYSGRLLVRYKMVQQGGRIRYVSLVTFIVHYH